MPPAITITDLTHSFSKEQPPALDHLTATIQTGRITGLVGPDGAGKTTLMRLLAGLLKPTAGTIHIHAAAAHPHDAIMECGGRAKRRHRFERFTIASLRTSLKAVSPVADAPSATALQKSASSPNDNTTVDPISGAEAPTENCKLKTENSGGGEAAVGYMPQKFGLYEDLTVHENLSLHADLRRLLGAQRDATFARLLAFTDLARFTDRPAGKLSGGMKQKLGLACALLGSPRLLLLDEPGVGVDPISRRELWRMVNDLARDGITIIWSTAYLDEAERCDDVLLLNEGKLLHAGPPRDLTRRMEGRCFLLTVPAETRRARLAELSENPAVLDATIQAQNIRVILRENTAPSEIHLARQRPIQNRESKIENSRITAPPRFEDAFMDILGGAPAGASALTRILREIPRDNATVIETKNLTRKFGSFTAAENINLAIKRGEIYGLLGPNGAGKSTTFRMLCGLLAPTSGEARAAGIDLRRSPARARQRIGYMAQKFSLYGGLTVAQNLAFFSGAYGLHGDAQRAAIAAATDCFHLAPHLDAKSETLPLGYKQRLALACAVMHGPDLLFLDEPTSGVDPVTRREFWKHIYAAVQRGVTVMVTTHFMDEAEYCDRIGLVYRARIIASGTPELLKQQAATAANPAPTMEDAFITLVERSGL